MEDRRSLSFARDAGQVHPRPRRGRGVRQLNFTSLTWMIGCTLV
jgi:hypothetical protein